MKETLYLASDCCVGTEGGCRQRAVHTVWTEQPQLGLRNSCVSTYLEVFVRDCWETLITCLLSHVQTLCNYNTVHGNKQSFRTRALVSERVDMISPY